MYNNNSYFSHHLSLLLLIIIIIIIIIIIAVVVVTLSLDLVGLYLTHKTSWLRETSLVALKLKETLLAVDIYINNNNNNNSK